MVMMRYDLYLTHEKCVAENTKINYMRDLQQLKVFLHNHGLPALEHTSSQTLQQYLDQLDKEHKSKASIARFLSAAKGFFAYLIETKQRQDNPTKGLLAASVDVKPPQILAGEEIERLLKAPKCVDAKGYRDRSMLSLLYATGMRVGELLALDIGDVDLFANNVHCGSGKNARVLPVYQEAMQALSQYVAISRTTIITDVEEQALFVNMHGQRMSRQGFWKLMKHYQAEAGIETTLTPHTLRHSFAAHLLEHGAQLDVLQQMMGHANGLSTRVYGQLMHQHLKEEYLKTHPKAN